MAYIVNKTLYDARGDAVYTVLGEEFLTNDRVVILSQNSAFVKAVLDPIVRDLYRVELLYADETPREDISKYILKDSISYQQEYKNGQTRSISFSLINSDGRWDASPVKTGLWADTKIRAYAGIIYDDVLYWYPLGIYLLSNPSYNRDEETVSIDGVDKFAKLDGTLGGILETEYKIVPNTPIYTAIRTLLKLDTGNGVSFDDNPVIFPTKYASQKTPYTMTVNGESSIGDILLELGEILSCDVYYNEYGCLVFEPADELMKVANKPILWTIDDEFSDCTSISYEVKFDEVVNKVTVVGANINGAIVKHTAINKNAKSPSNIYMMPIRFEYISDSHINTNALCQTRAEYELQKKSIVTLSYSIAMIYVPFIQSNALIRLNDRRKSIYGQNLFVSSVSISSGSTSVTATNIEDLPY